MTTPKKPMQLAAPGLWSKHGEAARTNRSNQTPAEAKLWQALRKHGLGSIKFRRQHAIGPYIVDFYCVQADLVIELDGSSHDGRAEADTLRQSDLESLNLRVLRFTNDEVLTNLEGVLAAISVAITQEQA